MLYCLSELLIVQVHLHHFMRVLLSDFVQFLKEVVVSSYQGPRREEGVNGGGLWRDVYRR